MEKPLLHLFQHIPKTAGTSLTYVVERQYRPHLLKWYTEEAGALPPSLPLPKAVVGHFRFGFHQHFQQAESRYYTLLRNPFEQAFSHYHYLLKHPTLTSAYLEGTSLEDFVYSAHGAQFQLRFIAGMDNIRGKEEAALHQARTNLTSFYPVVGITEQFDDSLLLFAQQLGWKHMHYLRGAVNPSKPQLPKRLYTLWEKPLAQELELYEWVKKRFHTNLQSVENLDKKRHILHLSNRTMTSLSPWIVGLKRLLGKH